MMNELQAVRSRHACPDSNHLPKGECIMFRKIAALSIGIMLAVISANVLAEAPDETAKDVERRNNNAGHKTDTAFAGLPQTRADLRPVAEIDSKRDPNLGIPFQNVEDFHNRMRCGRGETKHLIIGGNPDGFAAPIDPYVNGQPPATNPNTNPPQPFPNTEGYDGTATNRHFYERLTLPRNISRGYVLFSLRANGGNQNDAIHFGDWDASVAAGSNNSIKPRYGSSLMDLSNNGFQSTGNLAGTNGAHYLASMADLGMLNGQTLFQFVQAPSGTVDVDTYLQDDTSIDYLAYSVCERPKRLGMTWTTATNHPNPINGTAVVSCHGTAPTGIGSKSCNAYQGDTACSTELPLLCIKKDASAFPLPASVDNSNQYQRWASGLIGTTKPMAAPAALSAANSACVSEFGADWRVAEHHDGWGWGLKAYGNVGTQKPRFWVDINNQPNAICWDRSQ